MNKSENAKIAYNTILLYIKSILSILITIYTSRILLKNLGESSYGIYFLIIGIVGFFNIILSNFSFTSTRFISYSLGISDKVKTNQIFNTLFGFSIIVGFIGLFLMLLFSKNIIDNTLNIPTTSVNDAHIVYNISMTATFLLIVAVPLDSLLFSNGTIIELSIIDIITIIFKLVLALLLTIVNHNLLIFYSFSLLIVQFVVLIIKSVICYKYFKEKISIDFNCFNWLVGKEILLFFSWNFLGSFASLTVNQFKSILINIFFGIKLNLAEGLSNSTTSQISTFSSVLSSAVQPFLMKSEGSGNREKMLKLTNITTKYTNLLFVLIAGPVFIELHFLLKLWLVNVPDYVEIFLKLSLISVFIQNCTFQLTISVKAIGNIMWFQIVESSIYLFIVPLTYFFYWLGEPPEFIYYMFILFSFILTFSRIYFAKRLLLVNPVVFLKEAVWPILLPMLLSSLGALTLRLIFDEGLIRFLFISILFLVSLVFSYWYFSLNNHERDFIRSYVNNLRGSIKIIK